MLHHHRTANDLGAIVLAEVDGKEQRGAVHRLIAEMRGEKAPANDTDASDTTKALLALATTLGAPAGTRKLLADLDARITAAKSAEAAVAAGQQKLAKARQQLEADRAAHATAIAKESADHRAVLARSNAEIEAARKAAADLKAKAEKDAAAVAALRQRLARKLQLIESAA